jgi:hypothetical protein
MTFLGKQIYETPSRKFQKRQTLSDESVQAQKFQTTSEKSETVSRKSSIQQTVSIKFQISQNGNLTAHANIPQ